MCNHRSMTPEAKAWWSADVVHLLYGVMAAVAAVSYLVASGGHALDLHWQAEAAGMKVAADALVCISAGFCAFFLWTIILHRQASSFPHPRTACGQMFSQKLSWIALKLQVLHEHASLRLKAASSHTSHSEELQTVGWLNVVHGHAVVLIGALANFKPLQQWCIRGEGCQGYSSRAPRPT